MSQIEAPFPAELESPIGGTDAVRAESRRDVFWRRLAEFLVLFLVIPAVFLVFAPRAGWLIPGLAVAAIACVALLWLDPAFERGRLLHIRAVGGEWQTIGWLVAVGGVAMAAAMVVWAVASESGPRAFDLPRRNLALWLMIMGFYPLFSVYPQEVIYRAFLMHRYREVFPGRWLMIAASAAAFAFGHVIFQNWLAVVLSLVGGALFAWRYERSRSLASVWVEHAIWGCLIFTVGLGQFFYLGAVGR